MYRSAVVAAALAALSAGPALAHPRLLSSTPAFNASVAPTARVVLNFSEPLVGRFSGAEVIEVNGQVRLPGTAAVSPKAPKTLVLKLARPLAPGAYTVQWHAVSKDTHRLEGRYDFTVN